MRIAVAASIATDNLMTFPGKFADQLIPEELHKVSLSFLVDGLNVQRGGVAGNISFGMGSLGLRPILVGAVGADFVDYRAWLERHGVDTESVHVSTERHTARFISTADAELNQIASFYPGAMSEAREIELKPIADRVGGLDLVHIGADDPEAMARHTEECRQRGIPFAADFSQQIALVDGDAVRNLVDGATYLFTNDYEKALVEQKSGWSAEEILGRVSVQVTTLGGDGVRIERKGEQPIDVDVVPAKVKTEPTGVGDGFRAGFLAGLSWGLTLERSAQLGSLVATYVLEASGPQEYELARDGVLERFASVYGAAAADEIKPHFLAS